MFCERQKEPGATDLHRFGMLFLASSGPQTWLTVIKDTLDMGTCQNLRVCVWDYHEATASVVEIRHVCPHHGLKAADLGGPSD